MTSTWGPLCERLPRLAIQAHSPAGQAHWGPTDVCNNQNNALAKTPDTQVAEPDRHPMVLKADVTTRSLQRRVRLFLVRIRVQIHVLDLLAVEKHVQRRPAQRIRIVCHWPARLAAFLAGGSRS